MSSWLRRLSTSARRHGRELLVVGPTPRGAEVAPRAPTTTCDMTAASTKNCADNSTDFATPRSTERLLDAEPLGRSLSALRHPRISHSRGSVDHRLTAERR